MFDSMVTNEHSSCQDISGKDLSGQDISDKNASIANTYDAPEEAEVSNVAVNDPEKNEVFKLSGEVKYRTMGWKKASVMFVKFQFATGVLSIPSCMYDLGAVPGCILVVVWGMLATYGALLMGRFRLNHEHIHSVGDAGRLIGGPILGEIVGAAYFISWVLPAGVSMLGVSIAFNAISNHAICTVAFTAISAVICTIPAALPRFGQIAVLTWVGFFSLLVAVLTVVVAVTQQDRPAAAPAGDYDLGFRAIAFPTFSTGLTASNIILGSYGGTPAFMSAAAEMRNPRDFTKAVCAAMAVTAAAYLSFSLVVYRYCGQYVASPALGSAGPLMKKISYGLALPGLLITATLFLHTASKFILVRALRGTEDLQRSTFKHQLIWYGSIVGISIIAFLLAEGIPFFNSLLSLLVLFTARNVLSLPMAMWFYDNRYFKRKVSIVMNLLHGLVLVVGLFCGIGGAVAAVISINDLFKAGEAGSAFSCADNSVS